MYFTEVRKFFSSRFCDETCMYSFWIDSNSAGLTRKALHHWSKYLELVACDIEYRFLQYELFRATITSYPN